jgi:N-acetylmuramoyl-L-alanine amidase CwlA
MPISDDLEDLNLSVELISPGRQNRRGVPLTPVFVTIHNTSNVQPGANAAAHSRFVRNTGFYTLPSGKKNWVSWHFTVDDKQAIQHLPTDERGIHAGAGNGKSLAIEVCMHRGIDQVKANDRAALLTAALLHDLKLTSSAVRTHKSWTGKDCPALLLKDWNGFIAKVDAGLAKLASVPNRLIPDAGSSGFAKSQVQADPEIDDGDLDHELLEAELVTSE